MNEQLGNQNFEPTPLPHDPTAAVQILSKLARRLIDLADMESQVLIKDDWVGLSSLQDSKEKTAWDYAHASEEFRNRIEEFHGVDKKLINKLDQLQRELGEKTHNNNALIEQMHHRAMGNTHKTLLAAQEIAQTVHVSWPQDQAQKGDKHDRATR